MPHPTDWVVLRHMAAKRRKRHKKAKKSRGPCFCAFCAFSRLNALPRRPADIQADSVELLSAGFGANRAEGAVNLLIIEVAVALLALQAIMINRRAGLDYPFWAKRVAPTRP
jgi:hypothetical protein